MLAFLFFFFLSSLPNPGGRWEKGNSRVVVYKNIQNRQLANLIDVEHFHSV
jgi:hypothetical protein